MATGRDVMKALRRLKKAAADWDEAAIQAVDRGRRDPFRVLVSTMLSLRTKDATTIPASLRLLAKAPDPAAMTALSPAAIEKLIYPVGFYKTKARSLIEMCRTLLSEHDGQVPDSLEGLLAIKGVGRKTANLVLSEGFLVPAICVDTHVHRISNRLGWVRTRTPRETEDALAALVPREGWRDINQFLVRFGQNVCLPTSPWCSRCVMASSCPREGVGRHR